MAVEPELVCPLVAKRLKELARGLQVVPEPHRFDVFKSTACVVNPFKEQGQLFQAHFQTNRAARLQVSDGIAPPTTGLLLQACQRVLHHQING